MDEENPRKTTPFSRSARNRRIVERLREGLGYDEIAFEERSSERRVRQIVKQALEGREAAPPLAPEIQHPALARRRRLAEVGLRSRTSNPSVPAGRGCADAAPELSFTKDLNLFKALINLYYWRKSRETF